MNNNLTTILIIDYGSQYTQLIARRIRELEVFCLVYPYHKITNKLLKEINFDGLYTLQTARGTIGDEVRTIKKHKKIIEGIYND